MVIASQTTLMPIADYFKVLSEVSRLQVLCALKDGPKNVTEIMAATQLKQANVSKHLQILSQSGLVARMPQGVSVYYEIADSTIFALCDLVCDRIAQRLETQAEQLKILESVAFK